VLTAALVCLALAAPAAFAVMDQPDQPAGNDAPAAAANPEAQAALDAGIASLKDAEGLEAGSVGTKLSPELKGVYTRARTQFEQATKADATLAAAWNGLGYSQRKLGDYKAALVSYGRALALKSDYADAIEYRGEAYLSLGRIEDAKQAYLDLFASHRSHADKLLESMKQWIAGPGKGKAAGADLAEFVEERAKIAAQTAALTREGASAGWR